MIIFRIFPIITDTIIDFCLGRKILYQKGADVAIKERLKDDHEKSLLEKAQRRYFDIVVVFILIEYSFNFNRLDEHDNTLRSIACGYRDCTEIWDSYIHDLERSGIQFI